MKQTKRWRELSATQRMGIVFLSAVQLALLGAAQLDIHRRPAAEIKGSKRLWSLLAFVNFLGPIVYFAFGRER